MIEKGKRQRGEGKKMARKDEGKGKIGFLLQQWSLEKLNRSFPAIKVRAVKSKLKMAQAVLILNTTVHLLLPSLPVT